MAKMTRKAQRAKAGRQPRSGSGRFKPAKKAGGRPAFKRGK